MINRDFCIDGADDDLVSTFAAMRTVVVVVVVHTFTFFTFHLIQGSRQQQ